MLAAQQQVGESIKPGNAGFARFARTVQLSLANFPVGKSKELLAARLREESRKAYQLRKMKQGHMPQWGMSFSIL